jgi:hypothetical protein
VSFISRRESRGASKVKAENNDKKQAIISSNIAKISFDWQVYLTKLPIYL